MKADAGGVHESSHQNGDCCCASCDVGGNASAAPLGASLALRDALTPTARFVQWGGDYDGGGYGGGGYGGGGFGGLGGYGGYGGYAGGNGGYRPYYPPYHYAQPVYRGHRNAPKKDRESQSATR